MKYAAQKVPPVQSLPATTYAAAPRVRMQQSTQWKLLLLWLAAQDMALTYLAFVLAFSVRFQTSFALFELEVVPEPGYYQRLWLIMLPMWLLAYFGSGLYNRHNILQGTREASLLFNAASLCAMGLIVVDFFHTSLVIARGWIVLIWVSSILLVGSGRVAMRFIVRLLRRAGYLNASALIVGANAEGKLLMEQLYLPQYSGLQIMGFIDDEIPVGSTISHGMRSLGRLDEIDELVKIYGIQELILSSSALSQEQIVRLFEKYGVSGQTNIRLSSGLYEIITTGIEVSEFACVPLVKINRVRLTGLSQFEKILLDYIIAVPLAVVLLPVYGLLALLVRLDSPGPVIYRRRVMGVNGRQFDAFKFRTMRVDGDEILNSRPDLKLALERDGKLKDDPRVTRVGRFLRKFSLDELPQLINVLRQEMSIVGPRMISPPEMAIYKQHGMNLLTVNPGITGLWQVSGRSDVTYDERVRLDMYYIRNWSIWLDLQLLWRTIPAVLLRRGAY